MKFSEIPLLQGCFETDAAFENLGALSHRLPGCLVYCLGRKFVEAVNSRPDVVAVVAPPQLAGLFRPDIRVVTADDPQLLFYQVHNYLADHTDFYRRDLGRHIDPSARIHPSCVLPEADLVIGPEAEIGPHVTIYEGTVIRAGAVIQAGAVIGLEGWQVVRRPGRRLYARHMGGVEIGPGARIGANACLERGVFRHNTVVGEEAAVGELVCLGHASSLEPRALVLPCAIICGSAVVEEEALVYPAAMVTNGARIGARATVGLGALVKSSVEAGEVIMGQASPTARQEAEAVLKKRGKVICAY